MGIEDVCLVAVSVYGHDNRSMFDAMRNLSGDSRAVVSFNPYTITEQELDKMHAAGVRGVRINLKTTAEAPSKEALAAKLLAYAARIRSRQWVLQLYLGIEQVPLIYHVIPQLGVKVVLDHMASPEPTRAAILQTGSKELFDLLRREAVWVKISGTYRFTELPDLDVFARDLIRIGQNNVIWASDWPHTGGPAVTKDGRLISSYRKVDDEEFVQRCLQWCDYDDLLVQKLFVDNPRRLWLGDHNI